jgi:pyrroloquinoline quinone biosynthesis protein D
MNASAVLRLARGVRLHNEEGGVAFLLVPEGVVELSPTALAIVQLLDGARTVDDIVQILAQRYDATAGELRGDVEELCHDLRSRGFLVE